VPGSDSLGHSRRHQLDVGGERAGIGEMPHAVLAEESLHALDRDSPPRPVQQLGPLSPVHVLKQSIEVLRGRLFEALQAAADGLTDATDTAAA